MKKVLFMMASFVFFNRAAQVRIHTCKSIFNILIFNNRADIFSGPKLGPSRV